MISVTSGASKEDNGLLTLYLVYKCRFLNRNDSFAPRQRDEVLVDFVALRIRLKLNTGRGNGP